MTRTSAPCALPSPLLPGVATGRIQQHPRHAAALTALTENDPMDLPRNAFKHAIAAGQLQIGLWCSLCSNIAADIVRDAGFDWLLLDTEHSPNDVPDMLGQLQAVRGGTATPIVRPAWNDTVLIKRYPRHRRADAAGAVRAERGGGEARGRGDALSAARRARRRRLASRASRYGRVTDYLKKAERDLRAGAGRDPRRRWSSSRRSPRSTASTACSSGRPISPPRSAISAIPPIPRCRRRWRTR